MAIENLYATSYIAGSWLNPNNANGNTPTTWAGTVNTNTTESGRWHIGDPVNPLIAGATQTIRILARKGTNSGNPSITINLWENGVLVRQLSSGVLITNTTTGQIITTTFLPNEITNRNNVEIEVVGVFVGGSGNARNSPQIAYIHWAADTAAPVAPASLSSLGSTSVVTSAVGQINVSATPVSLSSPGSTSIVTSPVGQITTPAPAVISGVGSTSIVTSPVGQITTPAVSLAGVGSTAVVTSDVGVITTPIGVLSGAGSSSVVTSDEGSFVSPGTPNPVIDLSGIAGSLGEVVLSWSEPIDGGFEGVDFSMLEDQSPAPGFTRRAGSFADARFGVYQGTGRLHNLNTLFSGNHSVRASYDTAVAGPNWVIDVEFQFNATGNELDVLYRSDAAMTSYLGLRFQQSGSYLGIHQSGSSGISGTLAGGAIALSTVHVLRVEIFSATNTVTWSFNGTPFETGIAHGDSGYTGAYSGIQVFNSTAIHKFAYPNGIQ